MFYEVGVVHLVAWVINNLISSVGDGFYAAGFRNHAKHSVEFPGLVRLKNVRIFNFTPSEIVEENFPYKSGETENISNVLLQQIQLCSRQKRDLVCVHHSFWKKLSFSWPILTTKRSGAKADNFQVLSLHGNWAHVRKLGKQKTFLLFYIY